MVYAKLGWKKNRGEKQFGAGAWRRLHVYPGKTIAAQKTEPSGANARTHPCATTTPEVRRAIQASEEKNIVLAKRYGVNRKTIAKWKAREVTSDERMGPKSPQSTLLSQEDDVVILAYRWRTRLALNDCH